MTFKPEASQEERETKAAASLSAHPDLREAAANLGSDPPFLILLIFQSPVLTAHLMFAESKPHSTCHGLPAPSQQGDRVTQEAVKSFFTFPSPL